MNQTVKRPSPSNRGLGSGIGSVALSLSLESVASLMKQSRNLKAQPATMGVAAQGLDGNDAGTVGMAQHRRKIATDGRLFLTPAQIAARWGYHEESVRRMLRRRQLGSVLLGRRRWSS